MNLPFRQVADIMEALSAHPVKQFFWAKHDPQTGRGEAHLHFNKEGLARMLEHRLVIQGGEVTNWQGVLVLYPINSYQLTR
jgi:adenine deaminase